MRPAAVTLRMCLRNLEERPGQAIRRWYRRYFRMVRATPMRSPPCAPNPRGESRLAQSGQQLLRSRQIRRPESFREPMVDRLEDSSRIVRPFLNDPQTREIAGRAEFPEKS